MITDILDHEDGTRLEAEIVVVGSGIAGSELAMHLSRAGRRVLLLESGRRAFDPGIQALNDIDFLGKPHRRMDPDAAYHAYLPPGLRGVSRVRQFGGTSTVWTGKWKLLQRSDFAERDWVDHSEWPIGYDHLLPFYRATAKDYGLGDLEAEAERPDLEPLRGTLARHGLKMTSFYHEKSPLRAAERFEEEMRSSSTLHVILGATATELRLDPARRRVASVECRSLEGRRIDARGATVVLATGGLETPRLLLASDRDVAGGIGNAHDLVGRFYGDHPKHHSGTLAPGPLARAHARELQYAPNPRFVLCFALDDAVQRAGRLLEHVVYLKPIYEGRRRRLLRRMTGGAACVDGNGSIAAYQVKIVTEQVPNPRSRISLAAERDALGVRRLQLDWQFTDRDTESLPSIVSEVTERFAAAGLGTFDFGDDPPNLDSMTDAAHQIGTTRMASDPTRGVVDTDCRVFGTENLYVASSAVFPTCPSYSPTFTILALARRLGDHLLATAPARSPAPMAALPS
ncbi:MAG: GMC family oxidoreductase [Azospirillaceae bacterium]